MSPARQKGERKKETEKGSRLTGFVLLCARTDMAWQLSRNSPSANLLDLTHESMQIPQRMSRGHVSNNNLRRYYASMRVIIVKKMLNKYLCV